MTLTYMHLAPGALREAVTLLDSGQQTGNAKTAPGGSSENESEQLAERRDATPPAASRTCARNLSVTAARDAASDPVGICEPTPRSTKMKWVGSRNRESSFPDPRQTSGTAVAEGQAGFPVFRNSCIAPATPW